VLKLQYFQLVKLPFGEHEPNVNVQWFVDPYPEYSIAAYVGSEPFHVRMNCGIKSNGVYI